MAVTLAGAKFRAGRINVHGAHTLGGYRRDTRASTKGSHKSMQRLSSHNISAWPNNSLAYPVAYCHHGVHRAMGQHRADVPQDREQSLSRSLLS